MKKDHHYLIHYWRWQFLRESKFYKTDYDAYLKYKDLLASKREQATQRVKKSWARHEANYKKHPSFLKVFTKYLQECEEWPERERLSLMEKVRKIFEVHGITMPVDPQQGALPEDVEIAGYFNFAAKIGELSLTFKNKTKGQTIVGNHLIDNPSFREPNNRRPTFKPPFEDEIVLDQRASVKAVQVVVDFDAPKTYIVKEIEAIIDEYQKKRIEKLRNLETKQLPQKVHGKKMAHSISNLKNCLDAFKDHKRGKTMAEIAKKLGFTAGELSNERNPEKTVNELLNKAKKFIQGEYRSIYF